MDKMLDNVTRAVGAQLRDEIESDKKEILDALEQLYKAPLLNDLGAIASVTHKAREVLKKYGRLSEAG